MCPPVFWEEISEEERQSSLCFSPETPRFLRWSAETANLLSSKDSSCLKVTECLFHHFLRNAPYAARVRPNDEPFTALRVSEVESSGVRGISEGKEKYKNIFSLTKNLLWKEKSKGGRKSLCFSIALCYIGDCTCSQFTGLRAHPLRGREERWIVGNGVCQWCWFPILMPYEGRTGDGQLLKSRGKQQY